MPLAIATTVSLEDQGEGWFPLASPQVIRGNVVAVIPSSEPYYVIRLEVPLEVQESDANTLSRLRLHRYEYAVINSRWVGVALASEATVSTHVRLVPPGSPLPSTAEACTMLPLRIWATCHVSPSYA